MSVIVTVRAQVTKRSMSNEAYTVKRKWEVIRRFTAASAREAMEEVVKLMEGNPEFGVSIMRKREGGHAEGLGAASP